MKWLLSLVLVLTLTSAVDARYCNSPNCAMCNRLFGYMPGYGPKRLPAPVTKAIDSTPQAVVDAILALAQPKPTETLYDLGCGDGRFVITAAKEYGCKAVGVDISWAAASLAQKNVNKAGVANLVTIIHGDAAEQQLLDADIVVMYLFPETIEKMCPAIFHADRIISYSHPLPRVATTETILTVAGDDHPIYRWNRQQYGGMLPPESFLANTAIPPEQQTQRARVTTSGPRSGTTLIKPTATRRRLFYRWRRN